MNLSKLLAIVWPLAAAALGADLKGIVADPSGAVVPGVSIRIRDLDTGAQQGATTIEDGSYHFANLAAGRYEVSMDQAGFQPYRKTDLQLDGDLRLDITLELVPQSQSVTVSEDILVVDTSSTQAGETIGAAKIKSVPLNGRSFTDLLALQPGVVPASSQQPNAVVMAGVASTPPSGGLNPGNISVSGQRETANGFVVNGSDVEETVNMGTAIVPNLDSIAEFRVLTNNFNAEFGNYSGGQILVETKSGANQIHGDVFEFFRNTDLDARNFFSSSRATFDQNQFGGTFGGPVRRDRVFFFADYQGTRTAQGVDTGLIRVPSLADRSGDLQDLANQLTGTVNGNYWANLLTQKLGYGVQSGEPYYTPACTSTLQCVFPDAIIPQRAWSAPAKSLLPYIPLPNVGADEFSTSAYNSTLHDDKGAIRLDANTRFGMLAAYYFADGYWLNNPYPTGQGGANVPGFNALNFGRAQLLSLSANKAFDPTMVNELHFSYMRDANTVGQPQGGVGDSLASQGITGVYPLVPKIEGIENVSFNDFTIGVDTTGLNQVNNTYQWSDNLSKIIGTHALKFGAMIHYDQINTSPDAQSNGSFAFQGTETGVDFADFLLGIASSYTQADSQNFYNRNHYIGVYGQDSWRMTRNLTLNYGLRWDVLPPWHEKYNQLQTLVLGEQSVVYPGAPQGLVFPGDPGIPSTLAPTKYDSFAPRIGLAWSADAKTSIRAGYGMFYTAFEGLAAGIMSANPPYGFSYTSPAPPLFATPFVNAATGQDNGQRFPLPFPSFGAAANHPNDSIDWSMYEPLTGIPSFYHQNVPPYAENFTLSIERQFKTGTIVRTAYVGSQAHHLLVIEEANPGNAALCLSLAGCGPFGESSAYVNSAGQTIQGTRGPFSPAFGGVSYQKTIGNSNYNALEASIRHNLGRLELMAGYTFSKSMDQSSSLAEAVNPLNPSLSRAISAFDMTHNFVASYRYEIPKTHGLALSGVTRFSSGFPVTLFNNNDTSLLGTIPNGVNNNGVDTPDYMPGPLDVNTNPRNGAAAFNTSLFSLPGLGEIGTAARRFFYGPGIENFDVSIEKKFQLGETKSMQLRMEAFNVWNHAQFYGAASVNGNISSSNFGQIVSSAAPRLVQLAARFQF